MKRTLFLLLFLLLLLPLLVGCTDPEPPIAEDTPLPSDIPAPTQKVEEIVVSVATEEPVVTATPVPTPPLCGITIGIDPGHQRIYNRDLEPIAPNSTEKKVKVAGGTRGIASRVYEYEVVLDVGLLLRDLLEEAGATVVMTRTSHDVNLSNMERALLFNEHEVDLAIRLHCNGTDDENVRGAFMLIPAEQRTQHFETNERAATLILARYLEETELPMRGRDGVMRRSEQTGFNWCTQPILCIELGHMSNRTEDLLLTSPEFQQKMAQGLYNGIYDFFLGEETESDETPVFP